MARELLAVGLIVVAAGGCGGGSDKAGGSRGGRPVVLTLANFNGDTEEIDGFIADVRRLLHGTLRVVARNRWRRGQVRFEHGLIADVAKGRADLGIAGSRAWDSVGVDSLRALNAPLLIDSYALQERVLRSVWRMTTKYGDVPADPEPVPENYGDWTFVLDRGYFAAAQQYRGACTWGYGTYVLTGRRMALTFVDGGGIAPTGAVNKPGEFFRFGWSMYRDTLTLSAVRGAISPVNFRGRAWHRIGSTPSRRYFAKRCPPPAQALPG